MRLRVDMTAVPSQEEHRSRHYQHGQHLVVVPIDMLAAADDSPSKYAVSRRRQTEKYLQNCSGAPSVFVSAKYLQCIATKQKQRVSLKSRKRPLSRRVGQVIDR